MPLRLLAALIALVVLTAWRDRSPEWPASGPMPDEPGHSSRFTYDPVDKGTRSYRPVDPMPWGDVNRRVAPEGALPSTKPQTPPPTQPMQKTPAEPPAGASLPTKPEAPAKVAPAPATPPVSNAPPETRETLPKVDPVPREPPADLGQHQGH